ncbi:homoserine dehydrogenase [Peptoniphilus sp. ING2-D1G]|nr:homoserine dehydrogenase [Peptoniphilus sp. ING2-D1G]
MIEIALLGFGTVGKGTYEIIKKRSEQIKKVLKDELKVSKILVRNTAKYKGEENVFTDDYDEILKDDNISLVCEMTGDLENSYRYIRDALKAKKHVVTSNKAVVSENLSYFVDLADENEVNFLFEASVGGSIPIITPLISQCVINDIHRVRGILNGTSNFILSKMYNENLSYEDVLKEAQALGYAEADPYEDVEGIDALRKLKILSSIAFCKDIENSEILSEGISSILPVDIEVFKEKGFKIKLVAESFLDENKYALIVEPVLVESEDPLYFIEGSNNIVEIFADNYSSLSFMGEGAGKLPTGNAVVIDIIDSLLSNNLKFKLDNTKIKCVGKFKGSYYVRTKEKIDENLLEEFFERDGFVISRTKMIDRDKLKMELRKFRDEDCFIARFEREDLA